MASPSFLLIVALVCIVAGVITGYLIGSLYHRKEHPKPLKPVNTPVASRGGGRYPVASFWRDQINGPLVAEVDGKFLQKPAEMNGIQRSQLEELALELRKWLGYPIPAQPVPAPAPIPTPDAPLSAVPQMEEVQPVPATIHLVPRSAEKPVVKPASIVEQIDAILQDKLTNSAYANQGVRLAEVPNHGVLVWVGNISYQGIDAVPDPEIQALIRGAVADWEAKK